MNAPREFFHLSSFILEKTKWHLQLTRFVSFAAHRIHTARAMRNYFYLSATPLSRFNKLFLRLNYRRGARTRANFICEFFTSTICTDASRA